MHLSFLPRGKSAKRATVFALELSDADPSTPQYGFRVVLGTCHHDSAPWAGVEPPSGTSPTPTHDCSMEHIFEWQGWTCEFPCVGEGRVRLTFRKSLIVPEASGESLEVRIDLLGDAYEKLLEEKGVSMPPPWTRNGFGVAGVDGTTGDDVEMSDGK